jgi:hypothetical protein
MKKSFRDQMKDEIGDVDIRGEEVVNIIPGLLTMYKNLIDSCRHKLGNTNWRLNQHRPNYMKKRPKL